MPDPITTTPLTEAQQLIDKIAKLQADLASASPGYESLLHQIHVALHKDEEIMHLLSEEQVGVLCAGLAKKKNIVIADIKVTGSRNKASNGKALKELTLDDM